MADIPARMRQIIGTTADWTATNLVIGDGELALERAAAGVKAKVGDGTTRFLDLPYAFGGFDSEAGDARYVLLSDVKAAGGVGAANKIPRLSADGVLPRSFFNTIAAAANPAVNGAGKMVVTANNGLIDPSLVALPAVMVFRGAIDPTQPAPSNPVVGDAYIANVAGTVNAGFTGAAGKAAALGDLLVYSASGWSLVPYGSSVTGFLPTVGGTVTGNVSFLANSTFGDSASDKIAMLGSVASNFIPDGDATRDLGSAAFQWGALFAARAMLNNGTAATPSLSFIDAPDTGVFAPNADTVAFATSGAERGRINDIGLGINTPDPRFPIHVNGVIAVGDSEEETLRLNHDGVNAVMVNTKGDFLFYTQDPSAYIWHIGGTAIARLNGLGNFSIGGSGADARLEVVGPDAAAGAVRANNGTLTVHNGATGAKANRAGFEVATRRLPLRTTVAATSIAADDSGGGIRAAHAISVTVMKAGDMVTLFNVTDAPVTLTASGVTMYLAGDSSGSKQTLTLDGRGAATISYESDNIAIVSGQGVM
jgi:hypothetical protein